MVTVGIFIYDEVELLDVCAPFEVFTVAASEGGPAPGVFRTHLIAQGAGPVRARGGMRLLPDFTLANHPDLDLLLIPGGPGAGREMRNWRVIAWLQAVRPRVALAGLSTGALLLAEAGRLDGRTATIRGSSLAGLAGYERVHLCPTDRFVDNGDVLTSAGVLAGVEMALHLVERLAGREAAEYAAGEMEYEPQYAPGRGE